MAQTSTYLNFDRGTEEAFNFYKAVFGTEFIGGIMRHRDVPVPEGQPGPREEDKDLVMNVAQRVFVMDHGVPLFEGTPRQVQENPQVIEAYLGGEFAS